MREVEVNLQPLSIIIRVEGQPDEIYEGELELTDQQKADLKSLIGDGQAKVTVSREYSDKTYGNGGSVFVAVTLTCDQSQEMVNTAIGWANFLADTNAGEQVQQLQARLPSLGISQS